MATIAAIANGNFSIGDTWNGGVVPGPGDDVDLAGFIVEIDAPITCQSITDSVGTGYLDDQSNVTVSAHFIATRSGSTLFRFSQSGCTLNGDGTATGGSRLLLIVASSATIATISGNWTADGASTLFTVGAGASGYVTFQHDSSSAGIPVGAVPAAADVRYGTAVAFTTGLAHIPAASSVALSVPVDQTVGTLPPALTAQQARDALDLPSTGGAASVDTQLAAIKADADAIKVTTDKFRFTITNQVDANALTGGGGGSGLTQQQVADALKLAPSGGSAAAGSAQKILDVLATGAAGTGNTPVNHNTGGADNLRIQVMGIGVDAATIRAYLYSDWTANAPTAALLGSATTGPDGRWIDPIYLTAGNSYAIVVDKAGVFSAATMEVTI